MVQYAEEILGSLHKELLTMLPMEVGLGVEVRLPLEFSSLYAVIIFQLEIQCLKILL